MYNNTCCWLIITLVIIFCFCGNGLLGVCNR